jgi:hypothetical protein
VGSGIGLGFTGEQFTTVVADFDDDGGLDFCHRFQTSSPLLQAPLGVALLRNSLPRGNWLKIATRGRVSNRDGIGARIVVEAGGVRQRQWVRSGTGFMGDSDRRVHFGLGPLTQVDLLEITWPSGQVQYWTGVAANQVLVVEEPTMLLRAPALVGGTTHVDLRIPGDQGLQFVMALAMSEYPHTPLPDGRALPFAFDAMSSVTLIPGNFLLPGSGGFLDAQGGASSPLNVPALPFLAGMTIVGTAVTVDFARFPLLRTLFPRPLSIRFQ